MEATTGFSDMQYEDSNNMKESGAKRIKYKMDSHWCCGRVKEFAVATIVLLAFIVAIIALVLSCYNMYVLTNKLEQLERQDVDRSLTGSVVTASALKVSPSTDTEGTTIDTTTSPVRSTTTSPVRDTTTTPVRDTTTTPVRDTPTTPVSSTITSTTTGVSTIIPTSAPTTETTTTINHTIPPVTDSSNLTETGVVYTRWGRDECGSDAKVIYSGYVASSSSSSTRLPGGAVDYLCMPESPEYNKSDNREDNLAASWLFAAKFLSFQIGIFDDTHHGEIPKCSLCHAPRSSKIMIPARRSCPSGWTKEYEGYLMSSSSRQQKSTTECFDETPEIISVASNRTEGFGGARLYFVAGSCSPANSGHLPYCPPYEGAKELTCVICTK